MKRREFVTSVLGAGLAVPIVGGHTDTASSVQDGHGGHGPNDPENEAKLTNVTISFGHWGPSVGNPFDRFTNGNDRTRNVHQILPNPVKVHAGDSISMIISGFHNPQIFGPGTQPEDIDRTVLAPANPAFPAGPPIIADARN